MTAPEAALRTLHQRALRLEWATTLWNVVEAFVALGSGLFSGSTALVAFGIDSLIEVMSSVGLLWRLLSAGPTATPEEHERAERRALFVVAISFFLLALYIAIDVVRTLLARSAPETSMVGIGLSIASLIAMPALGYDKQRTARQMNSKALAADAVETWVCAYLSAALLAGLGLHLLLGWWWVEPLAALAMVPFITWQGLRSLRKAQGIDEA